MTDITSGSHVERAVVERFGEMPEGPPHASFNATQISVGEIGA